MGILDKTKEKIADAAINKKVKEVSNSMNIDGGFAAYNHFLRKAKRKVQINNKRLEKAKAEGNQKKVVKIEKQIAQQEKLIAMVEKSVNDGINTFAKMAGAK